MFSSIRKGTTVHLLPAFLLSLWFCTSAAPAQNAKISLNQYKRAEWTAEQGFFSGRIEALAQTPDGYLWVGTTEGLFRFDGVRYVPVLTDRKQPLRQILGLSVDTKGALWVRAADTRIR